MKLLRYFFILSILSAPSVAFATPTQYGESGLISVPTTEVTGVGNFQVAAWVNNSQNNGNMFTLLPLSLSMGFSDGMELFASYPNVLLNADNDGSGRGYENIGVKFRLYGGTASIFRSTVDAFIRQAISGNSSLNGLKDSGGRLMFSYHQLRNTIIHFNAGYLKVSSPQGMDYKDETLFGSAIEFTGSERWRPFIEVDGNTRRDGGSPRIEVSPGVQYYLLSNLSAMIGGGYGATDAGPDYRVVASVLFTSGIGRYVKPIPVIAGSRERYAESTVTPEELMPEIPATPQEDVANKGVTLPESAPMAEKLDGSPLQSASAMISADISKPANQEILTPGALTTSADMAPLLLEPPMPAQKTMIKEKTATGLEKASIRPEIPAELPAVAFAPPMPVAKGIAGPEVKPEQKAESSRPEMAEDTTPIRDIKEAKAAPPVPSPAAMATPPVTISPPAVAFAPPMPVAKGIAGPEVKPEQKAESSRPEITEDTTPIRDIKEAKAAPPVPSPAAMATPPATILPPAVAFAPPMPVAKGIAGPEVKPEQKAESSRPEMAEDTTPIRDIKEAKAAPPVPSPAAMATPPATISPPAVAFAPPMPLGVASAGQKTPKVVEQQSPAVPPVVAREEAAAATKVKKRTETASGEQKIVLQSDIMFAFNKSEIAQSGEQILNELSDEIKNDRGIILEVRLEGHTDNIGNAGYNKKLSLKRAKGVKAYLIRRGIKPEIISVDGLGYERPVASNDTPEGRDRNRRVDMTIHYKQIQKKAD